MADVTVTAANVAKASDTLVERGYLGATVTAGQAVYKDPSTGLWHPADANASAITAAASGIALNGGSANQPVEVATGGTLNPGFTVTVGGVYVVSATAGGIAPVADLVTGWRTTILGVGLTASSLALRVYASGAAVP